MSSNQAGSNDSDRRSRIIRGTISVVSGCLVCAVGAALFWKKIRVALKSVPDDLGWFWGALIAAGIFLLVALFVYFVAKRTLWELAALLIVPLALVGVGLWFTMQQDARQQAIENQRVQAAALQAYLDQMSQLLLEENLLNAEDGDEVLTLARARTLTTLEGLDSPRHKGAVIRFLSEAGLINDSVVTIPEGGVPPISLSGVNLQEADLTVNIALNKAFLEGANLRNANLSGTSLEQSNLYNADLREAVLQDCILQFAVLDKAKLEGANLNGADLFGATGWTEEQLTAAKSLEGATMPDGQDLKGDSNPNGPTFEEWLKHKDAGRMGRTPVLLNGVRATSQKGD